MGREPAITLVNWASRLLTAAAQVLTIRWVVAEVGIEGFAVFALIVALGGWFLLSDFGFGSSLQNSLSESRGDRAQWQRLITLATVVSAAAAALMAVLLAVASPWLGPAYLEGSADMPDIALGRLFFIGGLLAALGAVGGISYRVLLACDQSVWANALPALGAVLGLLAILAVPTSSGPQMLEWLLLAALGPSALIALATTAVLAIHFRADWRLFDLPLLMQLGRRAMSFWAFMLIGLTVLQIDWLVISQLLDSDDIVRYSIATRVFGVLLMLHSTYLATIWPECTIAIKNVDRNRVYKLISQAVWVGMGIIVAGSLAILAAIPMITEVLAPGADIRIPAGFIVLLSAYAAMRVWSDTHAMVLQSGGLMTPFWLLVPVQAVVGLILQLWLARRYGIYGVTAGLLASFSLTVAWGLPLAIRKWLR